jgi:predicted amidohydrolase
VNAIVVSCCQVAPALGDPAANRELAADAISGAAAQGASVVVLPELVSSGYVLTAGPTPKPARRRPTAKR